ncbi:MAG: TPM domain-containing protein [Candidatus Nomurabacteria bacterium]|jgi:uncharacterized protein|nr:TPM domain-containing protein [Candidatus Nomurabacteria bacterium]
MFFKSIVAVVATMMVIAVGAILFMNLPESQPTKDYTDPNNVPTFTAGQFVYDEGDVLSDETERTINAKSLTLFKENGATLVVASVPSLGGKTIEQVSYAFASNMAIGDKERDDGVLLLFSKTDSRVRLEIGKGLEGVIPDGKAGRILDNYFVPYRNEDNYDLAAVTTVATIVNTLTGATDGTADIAAPQPEEIVPVWLALGGFAVVFIGSVVFIAVASTRQQNRMYQKWLIAHPNGTKSQWRKDRGLYGGWIYFGGAIGGGFGGFGGGGGGFGGGSSGGSFGGGGASR